jgi:hypothetical protein
MSEEFTYQREVHSYSSQYNGIAGTAIHSKIVITNCHEIAESYEFCVVNSNFYCNYMEQKILEKLTVMQVIKKKNCLVEAKGSV